MLFSIILKFILIALIVYYILTFVIRLALPFLLRRLLHKTATEAKRRANAEQRGSEQQQGGFSETTSASAHTSGNDKRNKRFKGGDYIDYEEN